MKLLFRIIIEIPSTPQRFQQQHLHLMECGCFLNRLGSGRWSTSKWQSWSCLTMFFQLRLRVILFQKMVMRVCPPQTRYSQERRVIGYPLADFIAIYKSLTMPSLFFFFLRAQKTTAGSGLFFSPSQTVQPAIFRILANSPTSHSFSFYSYKLPQVTHECSIGRGRSKRLWQHVGYPGLNSGPIGWFTSYIGSSLRTHRFLSASHTFYRAVYFEYTRFSERIWWWSHKHSTHSLFRQPFRP